MQRRGYHPKRKNIFKLQNLVSLSPVLKHLNSTFTFFCLEVVKHTGKHFGRRKDSGLPKICAIQGWSQYIFFKLNFFPI